MTSLSSAHAQIECSDQPLDFSFHPKNPYLLAATLVDGTLEVHDTRELIESVESGNNNANNDDNSDDEIDTIVSSTRVHTQQLSSSIASSIIPSTKQASGRAVIFNQDGTRIYTGGAAGDLCTIQADIVTTFSSKNNQQQNPVVSRIADASLAGQPIQVLYELLDENQQNSLSLLATGDEGGCVRLWDVRLLDGSATSSSSSMSSTNGSKYPRGCVQQWHVHTDYVSGFAYAPQENHTLISASADGVLAVYDVRAALSKTDTSVTALPGQPRGVIRTSDSQDDELMSIVILKHGRKVVCGTAEGILNVWSWNIWGDISDRYPGHAANIDALLKIDEDTVLMGSSDGFVRVVQIMPDKVLGVLADHQGFPVEKLGFNADRSLVGSLTHDEYIRLWDARILSSDYESNDQKLVQMDATATATVSSNAQKSGGMFAAAQRESDDDWEDMDANGGNSESDDDDEDMDGSDSDDSDDNAGQRGGQYDNSRKFKTDNEKFFEDL